ncbi:MAG: DNA-directed RNA polymerase subunit alpha C-terminal domain-containing protein [Phycisphaerae bacterium]|jgi:DNA-directed RNA polymerase subunit alpha
MEQALAPDTATLLSKETWTVEDYKELVASLAVAANHRAVLAALSAFEAGNKSAKGGAAVKLGIIRYVLCRFARAIEIFGDATDNKDRRYFQGLCHKALYQYDKAVEEFDRAKAKGFDEEEIEFQRAESLALAAKGPEAGKIVSKWAARKAGDARWLYVAGLINDLAGFGEKAAESYQEALKADAQFAPAIFRLAFYCDLHGEEEEAVRLYKECLSHPPIYVNALLNLAVLYEDIGQNEQALRCLQRVLTVNPNHPRARLFLKDAEASRTMFFDEDQAKRVARRNAVLDIPVTDFELSVRARNCLKKMNIRTLGDLVRTTELDLLGYKNFGETSLKEIKDMLTAKNLRLGQALEESADAAAPISSEIPLIKSGNEGVLATPVEQLELSIRARKALEGLKITTLGQLASKSEPELLACKNFGQTSLNEIRQRLTENGLRLRDAD